ncbi:Rv3654c family TadE-like protein [Microbacterium sp. YY-01]|uniref:Rv3654c family TadE-like protein n=1 Tax=Microbacterium sp. YY-01 TaxID=3421634 RepID=UPI003D175123
MPGTTLSVGLVGIVAATAMAVAAVTGGTAVGQRTAAAADAAALAAADTASGAAVTNYAPCRAAEQVAAAFGASVAECELRQTEATVTVQATYAVFTVTARARAGPPGGLQAAR